MQGAQTAQDTAFAQEQAAVKQSTRMSDSATTSAAMQSFDVSSLNPTGNNIRATQQYQGRAVPAGAGAAAPTTAPAVYGFAAAPYDPTAAPQKVAMMAADGSYRVQAAAPSAAYSACAHSTLRVPQTVLALIYMACCGVIGCSHMTVLDASRKGLQVRLSTRLNCQRQFSKAFGKLCK